MNAWVLGLIAAGAAQGVASWRMTRKHRLAEPDAEAHCVPLAGLPGANIALYRFRPEVRRVREPVILAHGLGANRFNLDFHDDGRGSARLSLARYLAGEGFEVWALETRGTGRAQVPTGARWSLLDEAREDVATAIRTVTDASQADRVFWVGHSKGGLLQLLHQALGEPTAKQVRGMVVLGTPGDAPKLSAAAQPFLKAAAAGWAPPLPLVPMARLALPWATPLARIGHSLLPHIARFPAPMLKRLLASLPTSVPPFILQDLARWTLVGRIDDERGAPLDLARVQCPALFVAGSRDWLAPAASVRTGYEAVSSEDKAFMVAGESAGVIYGHGGLLLAERAPIDVFPVLAQWLAQRASRFDPCDSTADPPASPPWSFGPS
jgi:pimeloyl-ACP methyl ester carboxylesterase